MPGTSRTLRHALMGLFVAATTLAISCRGRDAINQKNETTPASVIASAPVIASARPGSLDPLQAAATAESVMATGDSNTTLLVPTGITTARPLVAILLPTTRNARTDCEALGATVRTTHFVLCCPVESSSASGVPAASSLDRIESDLLRAVHVTRQKYAAYVAPRELALVGIREAATAVAPIVRRAPEYFRRVALIQGGFEQWTSVDSARFVEAGAKSLLVVCSEPARRPQALRVMATVKALGTRVRYESLPYVDGATGAVHRESPPRPDGAAGAVNATPFRLPELLSWLMSVETAQQAQ